MKQFLFLISFTLFTGEFAQAQCANGRCNVNNVTGAYSYNYFTYGSNVVQEPALRYQIKNIVENERFYVNVKIWDRNYTIPVINGIIPEISHNGNYNNLTLDYSSKIEYTTEKFGKGVVLYNVDNIKNVKSNLKPNAPKGPDFVKINNVTQSEQSNVPKRPSDKEVDFLLEENQNDKKVLDQNSDEFIDSLLEK